MQNNFRSGFQDILEENSGTWLKYTGKPLLKWCSGKILISGGGIFNAGEKKSNHSFDGLTKLLKFDISEKGIYFSSKFIKSRDYTETKKYNRIVHTKLETFQKKNLLERLSQVPGLAYWLSDNPLRLFKLGNRLFGNSNSAFLIELNEETLDTVGKFSFTGSSPFCIYSPVSIPDKSSNLSFLETEIGFFNSTYKIFKINKDNLTRKDLIKITRPRAAFLFSFSETENYYIITEHPFYFEPSKFFSLPFVNKAIRDSLYWENSSGTSFLILDKRTGKLILELNSESFFTLSHLHSEEKGERILIDLLAYPDPSGLDQLSIHRINGKWGKEIYTAEPRRYTISIKDKKIRFDSLSKKGLDFPYISNRSSRYIYGISKNENSGTDYFNSIVQIDTLNGEFKEWSEEKSYPTQPIFINSPEQKFHNDGICISAMFDAKTQTGFLIFLDGRTFKEIGRIDTKEKLSLNSNSYFFP